MSVSMQVAKCPSDELSLSNRCIVNSQDFSEEIEYIEVSTGTGEQFVFTVKRTAEVSRNSIGFSMPQRMWASLFVDQDIRIKPYRFNPSSPSEFLCSVTLEVDFVDKSVQMQTPFDPDMLAKEFLMQFSGLALTVGQPLVFICNDMVLALAVKELEAVDPSLAMHAHKQVKPTATRFGRLLGNVSVQFVKAAGSFINLVDKERSTVVDRSLFTLNWDFGQMGIGGLNAELNAIFRRAFASRVYPPELMETLDCKHVKGMLLYGPPGTGKTLMARKICDMLSFRPPKIVNGPQYVQKNAGESEAHIRRLFADAEEEERRLGLYSGLHIIIFDEIDAICKARVSGAGNGGVHYTVVNQLLAKIDGVEQLNNILVIGLTNRPDMIDEALLRPGRLEIQLEIGLPDQAGRHQILDIHTQQLRKLEKISMDVDFGELAAATKHFSGADVAGLVRAAQSNAMTRLIKLNSDMTMEPDAIHELLVTRQDFMCALANDVRPALAVAAKALDRYLSNGILHWDATVTKLTEDARMFTQQLQASDRCGVVSVLLEGPPKCGKTAIAAKLALMSDFAHVKICAPIEFVGMTESAKCSHLKQQFDDAYRSKLSCLVLDDVERLLEYCAIGQKYSNMALQTLLQLLQSPPPKDRKLLIFATTGQMPVLHDMGMMASFTYTLHVPMVTKVEHMMAVLYDTDVFTKRELIELARDLRETKINMGIKLLYSVLDMARQTEPQHRYKKFLVKLEEEGGINSGSAF